MIDYGDYDDFDDFDDGDDDGAPGLGQPLLAEGDPGCQRSLLLLGGYARDLKVQPRRRSRLQLGRARWQTRPPATPLPTH